VDLGIKGRSALVCGASKGLGRACAEALAGEGVNLVLTARNAEALEAAARSISGQFNVDVVSAPGDITTQAGIDAALAYCPAPDILINNTGGPPLGDWRDFDREDWLGAVNNNMITSILLTRAVVDGMAERGFGRIINITSAMVKQPLPALSLSVAARLGLTGFVKAISATYIKSNVTMNNLLPENIATDRLKSNVARLSDGSAQSLDELMSAKAAASVAGRLGEAHEFGAVCAFYCSAQAGYMTGQNVMVDGGLYRGVF
jgi:3-oxoacyl-[acyl-carrier protein] reductase